jgi:hypothetical protein
MTTREMIVGGGREHIVGAHGHRDYDELMEMGAEPYGAHAQTPHAPLAPHALHAAPPHPHGGHYPHAPPAQVHPHHRQGETIIVHPHHRGEMPKYDATYEPGPGGAVYVHPQGHHPHHPQHGHHPHHGGGYHPHHEDREAREEEHGRHYPGERRMRIVKEEPRNQRQFPIGFELTDIAPGDEVDLEVKPQVLFRGERLAIAQSIARYFDVLDIKVGKDSQLAATGPLTGEAFETRAVGVRMELDTAQPGIVITLRVRNIDTAAHDFRAVLYGAVLE